jgi:outer membrane protein
MAMRASTVMLIGVLLLGPALAQEPQTPPAAPAPRDVHLLDDVPDYAAVLTHQWHDGVPQDVTDAEAATTSYGLLLKAPMQPTTLAECIALALKNNTDLQVQRLTPVAATTGVRSARSIFDPALFATINRDRSTTPATTFLTGGSGSSNGASASTLFNQHFSVNAGLRKTLLSGGQLSLLFNNTRYMANASIANTLAPQYTTSLGLSLNQPLLRNFGWKYSLLLVEIAQSTEQAAYHQYASAIAALVAQIERAYWVLVLATDNVRVQEQGMELAKELLRQNEGRFNVGALPHTAVLEAKVNVASREAFLIQARNSLDVARDTVRAIINAPNTSRTALIMVDPQDKPTVEPYQIDLDRSLRAALEQRPELQAAKLDIQGKGLQRKVAENQLLPQANLVAGIGMNGLSGGRPLVPFQTTPTTPPVVIQAPGTLDGGYGSAVDMLTDGRYYNYAIGASIEIPIDNAAAKASYSQANIALSQSKLSLQKLQEQVTLEITTAVSNLQSDLKSIEATRVARELAEENVRDQKARYDVGLATTKDLLDYADRLTRAQFAEIEALTRYNSDLAEMRRVDGTLLSARNILLERVTPEKAPWWATF